MKVLVIGAGGREHALSWKISQSPIVTNVFVAPGNGGTELERLITNIDIQSNDIEGLADFASKEGIDLTIIGPEDPLVNGITDRFNELGLKCFGPTKGGAQLEGRPRQHRRAAVGGHRLRQRGRRSCGTEARPQEEGRRASGPHGANRSRAARLLSHTLALALMARARSPPCSGRAVVICPGSPLLLPNDPPFASRLDCRSLPSWVCSSSCASCSRAPTPPSALARHASPPPHAAHSFARSTPITPHPTASRARRAPDATAPAPFVVPAAHAVHTLALRHSFPSRPTQTGRYTWTP